MKRNIPIFLLSFAILAGVMASTAKPRKGVIDQVAWVVGGEAIFLSDVEEQYAQMQQEGTPINGDPYCVIPEQLALQKLYLHQAKIDTIEPPEAQVKQAVERRMNYFVSNLGSKEKVEQYFRKPYSSLQAQMADIVRNQYITQQVQENLTKDIKTTPADVRKYFDSLDADSVPDVPMQVEVQILSINPEVPAQEIEDIKARLRDYADRVNRGESEFSTLAFMYSEDGSAMQGGELGFRTRADFVPEFSNVAFNLNDPKKVSRIVETEYGYHIIQLIEKRGEQANFRHILLTPKVSNEDMKKALERMDTLRSGMNDKYTFEEAVRIASQDKDSRNNKGIMVNQATGSSRFEMKDLPAEVARYVESMNPGDISEPFIMKDAKRNRDIIAIIKLTNRIDAHKATLSEDYNMLKEMAHGAACEKVIRDWVEQKISNTYVKISDGWDECTFQYEGWIKDDK